MWPDPHEGRTGGGPPTRTASSQGARYFMGAPVTREHCLDVVKNGYQRQRVLAAHYLCLLEPGTPLFNTSAPGLAGSQRLLAKIDAMTCLVSGPSGRCIHRAPVPARIESRPIAADPETRAQEASARRDLRSWGTGRHLGIPVARRSQFHRGWESEKPSGPASATVTRR